MSLVFWDTNIFVYLLEGDPRFLPRVLSIWKNMQVRGDQLCTSALTIGEALVAPYNAGDDALLAAYRSKFRSPRIRILNFDVAASERFAQLRAASNVSRSDALQLACAAQAGVDLFLTNDRGLSRLHVRGIQFISSLDNCPL
jgi:predicted nucleic acid-binding protein